MKHIKTPVETGELGVFIDVDNDDTAFEAISITDRDEQILLVPTDLKPDADMIASEIVTALNAHDALVEACEAAKNALSSAQWEYVSAGITLPTSKSSALVRAEMLCRAALALVHEEAEPDA